MIKFDIDLKKLGYRVCIFRVLKEEEVDVHLSAIAEKD